MHEGRALYDRGNPKFDSRLSNLYAPLPVL